MREISALLALAAAAAIFVNRRRLRGTTLLAPCLWAVAAFALLAAAELSASLVGGAAWTSHVRFIAAGATFCPLMALLGAKRPQDRAWQFVVLSLLGLVAFYALTELAYRPDRPLALHAVVRWLLVAPLVAIGLANHLPTQFWLPAILIAAGQLLLLSPQFPELQGLLPAWLTAGPQAGNAAALVGIAPLSTSVLVVLRNQRAATRNIEHRTSNIEHRTGNSSTLDVRRSMLDVRENDPSPQPSPQEREGVGRIDLASFDRAWLDFRNAFGTLWGLRVAARFNQSAEQLGWAMRLGWQGLEPAAAAPRSPQIDPIGQEHAMRQVLGSLLRRFVDDDLRPECVASRSARGSDFRGAKGDDGADSAESAGCPADSPVRPIG